MCGSYVRQALTDTNDFKVKLGGGLGEFPQDLCEWCSIVQRWKHSNLKWSSAGREIQHEIQIDIPCAGMLIKTFSFFFFWKCIGPSLTWVYISWVRKRDHTGNGYFLRVFMTAQWIQLKFSFRSSLRMVLLSWRNLGISEVMHFCLMIWVWALIIPVSPGFCLHHKFFTDITKRCLYKLVFLIQKEHRENEYSSDSLQLDI